MARASNVVKLSERRKPRVNRISHAARDKGYRHIDKDPVLIRLIEIVEQSPKSLKKICDESGVSQSCIRNWMYGRTKRPHNVTMDFVARAIGYARGDWKRL
jgi:hypothetical protein